MNILLAEDDLVSRRMLEATLTGWGYQVRMATNGDEAWGVLQEEEAPQLVLLDWMMPGMDGLEVCRKLRDLPGGLMTYVLLLTARGEKDDIVAGLDAGANDYVIKPFDREELRARVRVGKQMVQLQQALSDRIAELQRALAHVKQLQGILPICCYCKKVRNDQKYWERVEDYIEAHSNAGFSHGICPDCWDTTVRPQMEEMWGESVPYEEIA